ncbi:MAG: DUF3492 domain-containing protein, partial [Acidobacteriota bacterium]|nr:DUF3492 domain-containing protein [Acidobacteriota bacterium]
MSVEREADVCLVLEGTYPYVTGGVSGWAHDLIQAQSRLSFHLVALVPPGPEGPLRFDVPSNVIGLTRVELQTMPAGSDSPRRLSRVIEMLEEPLVGLTTRGGFAEVAAM